MSVISRLSGIGGKRGSGTKDREMLSRRWWSREMGVKVLLGLKRLREVDLKVLLVLKRLNMLKLAETLRRRCA